MKIRKQGWTLEQVIRKYKPEYLENMETKKTLEHLGEVVDITASSKDGENIQLISHHDSSSFELVINSDSKRIKESVEFIEEVSRQWIAFYKSSEGKTENILKSLGFS